MCIHRVVTICWHSVRLLDVVTARVRGLADEEHYKVAACVLSSLIYHINALMPAIQHQLSTIVHVQHRSTLERHALALLRLANLKHDLDAHKQARARHHKEQDACKCH